MAEVYSKVEYIQMEDEFEPCIVLRRKYDAGNNYFAIPRKECWQFAPELNPNYVPFLLLICDAVYAALEFDDAVLSKERAMRRMLDIENAITMRLDEIKTSGPVENSDVRTKVVGEVSGEFGGNSIETEIRIPYALG